MNSVNVIIAKRRLICSVLLLGSLIRTCTAQNLAKPNQHITTVQTAKPGNKKFQFFLSSVLLTSATFDTATTLHNLAQKQPKYSCLTLNGIGACGDNRALLTTPVCHEVNPILGSHPSVTRIVVTEAALTTGELFLARFLRSKGHHKLAALLIIESITEHSVAGGLNTRQGCF